jgi:hypothetical protein
MFVGYEPTSVLKFVAMDLYYSLTFDNLFFGYQSVDLLIPSNNAKVTYMTIMTKRRHAIYPRLLDIGLVGLVKVPDNMEIPTELGLHQ